MTVLHGFELLVDRPVAELNARARLYRHVQTGAQLLSLENDDDNKCFSINFFTPVDDSSGLPHIMEHSVLCGSKRFPLKEPFVELMKGSLNTFINAFTFDDKTCYPVASQNTQDLYNLIDVYMDAVFYPLIPPTTLEQEGWHYELEATDKPLVYKGVVFNEMKGAYSSPDNVMRTYAHTTLFPDNHYGVDAGGDPRVIPTLTYERFKQYHETYYHPSNALIYFYGNDDPEARLKLMDGYLKPFTARPVDKTIKRQPRFSEPRRVTMPFNADENDARGMVTLNWLLTETTETETVLGLQILSHILIATPASPLKKALLDSELGESVIETGIENQVCEMVFTTGMKGINPDDAPRIEALVMETLAALVKDGIEPDMVEAAINTVEFALRERNTGRFPRGLAVMIEALSTWLYDGDPLAPLSFETPLNAIRAKAARGRYFESLIQTFLLDNTHRAAVTLVPDPELQARWDAEEAEKLAEVRAAMSSDELQALVEATQKLQKMQEDPNSPETLALLPTLKLADLDRENKKIPVEVIETHDSKILYHDIFTNGIVYVDLGFNLHTLPQELVPYAGLFSRVLLEMGTTKEDFVKLSQRIGRKTGGISATSFHATHRDSRAGEVWLFLRGKCTPAQVDDLLAILDDVLRGANLDNRERFRQIVLEEKAQMESYLIPAGHIVVNTRLRARFTEADWANEQMSGISYLFFLRRLADAIENDWDGVRTALGKVYATLVNRQTMLCNVTLDGANWAQAQPKFGAFLGALPGSSVPTAVWTREPMPENEGLAISSQVNYVAKGASLYDLGYKLHGSHLVINNYLGTTWLWDKVRVQGGAYGGFSQFSKGSGVFTYLSYRDPNLLETLKIYDETPDFLAEVPLDASELERGIIGAIGALDTYLLPDARGYTSLAYYLTGESDEDRQRLREEVLGTRADDFRHFGEVLEVAAQHGGVVVLGSRGDMDTSIAEKGDWLTITKVM